MAERRSTDKAHIDKTIPIYQIIAMLITFITAAVTIVIYQSGIDSTQNIKISENSRNIIANKEASTKFEAHVIRSLDQINERGTRQEEQTQKFFELILDYVRSEKK